MESLRRSSESNARSAFYTEINASYTDENGTHRAKIPQWVEPGNPYLGHAGTVTRIIVK